MATQGLVTVLVDGEVYMKIVTGSDGKLAQRVANAMRSVSRLPTAKEAYGLALNLGFGQSESLVVVTENGGMYTDGDIPELYHTTFHNPWFNPRWDCGLVDNSCLRLVWLKVKDLPNQPRS